MRLALYRYSSKVCYPPGDFHSMPALDTKRSQEQGQISEFEMFRIGAIQRLLGTGGYGGYRRLIRLLALLIQ